VFDPALPHLLILLATVGVVVVAFALIRFILRRLRHM